MATVGTTINPKVIQPFFFGFWLPSSCLGKRRSRSRSRKRSRSKSRSRSRSPRRHKNSGSGSGRQAGKSRVKQKNRNRNRDKDEKEKKEESAKSSNSSKDFDFSSPVSFIEAWDSSFFTAPALLLLTTLGFVISSIPSLNELPVGGRLRLCIQNWRKVCSNSWVLDVVSSGYKMPFRFVPVQHSRPKNPEVSGPAHDILVQEAADLLLKEAIAPVEPVVGQFVSSYFAVTKPRSPGKFRPI